MYSLQKIDELYISSHRFLTMEDECYYFMEYTPPVRENKTAENSHIMNFKKSVTRKDLGDWHYKATAIKQISELFIQNISSIVGPSSILIPVPPSKMKTDPLYDDRIVQLVENYCLAHPATEYREIVSLKANMLPTHEEEKTPSQLMPFFSIDHGLCEKQKDQIIIVDDVLRNGAHFKAIQMLLRPKFPDASIIGLYIARTRHLIGLFD